MASSKGKKLDRAGLLGSFPSHPPSSPPPYREFPSEETPRHARLGRRLWPRRRRIRLAVALLLLVCLVSVMRLRLRSGVKPPGLRASDRSALAQFAAGREQCAALRAFPTRADPAIRAANPRWNGATGQKATVVLRNATLFDGEGFVSAPVDVVFAKGLVVSVAAAGTAVPALDADDAVVEYDLHGQFVTPGLVDMHSHHGMEAWPALPTTAESNEHSATFGPLTPFVRALDGFKPWDPATALIAAGGVTASLVLPGSGNIMGGQGFPVKNRPRAGTNAEPVVEEMLLEYGVPAAQRRRYMKTACGENPKHTYGHTRMGNVWLLRQQLARAKELLDKQDAWCAAAEDLVGLRSSPSPSLWEGWEEEKKEEEEEEEKEWQRRFLAQAGGFPEDLELDSTVGVLRGRVAVHNHCYEPEDFESMLSVVHEFGFTVRAFHHAIAAWQVPEMLKEHGDNVTVATFAEFGLYKLEGYAVNLRAGAILHAAGVPVAYKSDHSNEWTDARYLLSQAASGHAFGLSPDAALRAVTSVPAAAMDLDDRIGYVRPGYDADVVVWDAHPLSVGATPRQVFIDGVAVLDPKKAEGSTDEGVSTEWLADQPTMRPTVAEEVRENVCSRAATKGQTFVVDGIRSSFLIEDYPGLENFHDDIEKAAVAGSNLTLVITDGQVACLGTYARCKTHAAASTNPVRIALRHGVLAPGLTAVAETLGMVEITMEDTTGDGVPDTSKLPRTGRALDDAVFAKYGVVLEGKAFARARIGGVTRAVTPPRTRGGLVRGVSVGVRTGGTRSLLDGGVFHEDVALHVELGAVGRVGLGSGSLAVQELRRLLGVPVDGVDADAVGGGDRVRVRVGGEPLVLVVHAESVHDIQQVILLKRDLVKMGASDIDLVVHGGHGAHAVAAELAAARIPVILTGPHAGPSTWETKDVLPGPPLSRSLASVLADAGVLFAVTASGQDPMGESRIHDLALEAAWAAKYAGLDERAAIRLVSRNVETILRLPPSRDLVIWEGSPLQFGGAPALVFQDVGGAAEVELELAACWPEEEV